MCATAMANNSMIDRDKITIQQTLHGYKEGHNLLASSVDLNGQERRTLSVMTDYAGTGVEKGFTEYITGYPLVSSKFYAFSKTWYADEMPRPGCVWTHTLLIDLSILWMVNNLELLSSLFRRPKDLSYIGYNRIIQLDLAEVSENNSHFSDLFPFVSCQLYNSEQPIVIYSESAKQLELAILQTWLLQWPRLRRNFSFCTGSISPRKLESRFLDLQVVPKSRQWSIAKNDRTSLYNVDIDDDKCHSDWYERYLAEDKSEVVDFMRKMGADIAPVISNFRLLFECYLFLRKSSSENDIVFFRNVLSRLEGPEEGRLLKADLLQRVWLSSENKLEVMETIAHSSSFNGLKVNYDALAWDGFLQNAFTEHEIIIALEIVHEKIDSLTYAKLLSKIPLDRWLPIISLYHNAMDEIVEIFSPHIYDIKEIWKSHSETQDFWFEYFLQDPRTNWKNLLYTLIDTHNTRFIEPIYKKLESSFYYILFDYMNERDQALQQEWLYYIKGNLVDSFEALVNYEHYNTTLLKLFPAILSPTDPQWSKVSFHLIDRYLSSISTSQYLIDKTALQTFFLTSAFMGALSDKLRATTLLFQSLHNALEKNIYDPVTWQRFQAQMAKELYELVEVDFFSIWFSDRFKIPEWDRCEFLRRSLICAFLKFNWDFLEFVSIVTDKQTFEHIVKFCSEVKPLKKEMRILEKYLERNGHYKDFHLRVLNRYI